jgi:hypothetical protein
MGLLGVLADGASQSLGNIEKAVIEIIDMRGRKVTIEEPVSMQGSAIGSSTLPVKSVSKLSAASTFAGAAGIADALTDIAGSTNQALSGTDLANQLLTGVEGATRKLFYVQFNPSELSLSAYGGGLISKSDFSKGGGMSFEEMDVRITMNVNLIFDKVDPQDAFLSDKLNTSTSAVAGGALKAGLSLKGMTEYSVQNEVEAFIAALRSEYTRRISFHWGTMTYSGVLNRVSSRYTMFNTIGAPIRATVGLSIVCADQGVSAKSLGVWQKYYDDAFGAGDQSMVKASQKVGSLLNFNL